jgi:hypothetical protein
MLSGTRCMKAIDPDSRIEGRCYECGIVMHERPYVGQCGCECYGCWPACEGNRDGNHCQECLEYAPTANGNNVPCPGCWPACEGNQDGRNHCQECLEYVPTAPCYRTCVRASRVSQKDMGSRKHIVAHPPIQGFIIYLYPIPPWNINSECQKKQHTAAPASRGLEDCL